MTIEVAGLEDREDMVYLFGLDSRQLGEDEIQYAGEALAKAFEKALPIVIADDFEMVDKTVFYSELNREEWAGVVANYEDDEPGDDVIGLDEILAKDLPSGFDALGDDVQISSIDMSMDGPTIRSHGGGRSADADFYIEGTGRIDAVKTLMERVQERFRGRFDG